MVSERQRAANRANAKKSTGPKSRAGKQRSSRNSFRHGLSATPVDDGGWTARVDKLADKIVGSMKGAIDDERARLFAEAQLEVERARSAITATSAQVFAHAVEGEQSTRPATATELGRAVPALKTVKKLDRYLHRALSRRDRLVRSFAGANEERDLG